MPSFLSFYSSISGYNHPARNEKTKIKKTFEARSIDRPLSIFSCCPLTKFANQTRTMACRSQCNQFKFRFKSKPTYDSIQFEAAAFCVVRFNLPPQFVPNTQPLAVNVWRHLCFALIFTFNQLFSIKMSFFLPIISSFPVR